MMKRYLYFIRINVLIAGDPEKGNRQTAQTQIRRRVLRRLIRCSTVCEQFSYFSLGLYKSHSLTYLKLKSDSSKT